MPIRFSCKCGRKLKVADAMASQVGQCPSCHATLQIPSSSDAFDAARFLDAKDRPCPSCRKPIAAGAVVCVHCGYHRVAGTRVGTVEEQTREDQPSRLRLFGQRAPVGWIALVLCAILGTGAWYWLGPAKPLAIESRQYVHATDALATGRTLDDGTFTVGGRDGLVVVTPDDAGDHLLLQVGLKQGVIRERMQTAGYNSLFADSQFKLQPADGGPPLPVRILASSFDRKVAVNLAQGGTSDARDLFPPIAPADFKTDGAQGFSQGSARWLAPGVVGDVQFTTISGIGGTANTGGASATGHITLADPLQNPISLSYAGSNLVVDWPADCTGWWARPSFKRSSRSEGWYRHRFALLVERPASSGTHTLLYCDQPIATVRTTAAPPPRPPAATPIRPTTPQQHAQGQAQANNPLNYFSTLARARQRAQGLVSASNMNQFAIAIQSFHDARRRYPESLLELIDFQPDLRQVLANPRTGDTPGFIYEPPPPDSDPRDTPILWESLAGRKDPDGAILYADGRLE